MKLYIVSYSIDVNLNLATFHSYITGLPLSVVADWWHYLPFTYIIASDLEVTDLYNKIFPGIPLRYLLVIEANPNNAQGWLPPEAWIWLQKFQLKRLQ